MSKRGSDVDRPIPVSGLTGGEGWGGENRVEVTAMLWRLLGREMMAGGVRSTASGGRWSSEHGGGVAPVGFWRGEMVWELHESGRRSGGEAAPRRG